MEENKAQTTQGAEASAVGAIAGTETSEHATDNNVETDNTSNATFEDGEGSVEEKPKQTSEVNREYARKRRDAENARKIEETRVNAVIETLGGVNPFTNEAMTDAADVDEYLLMKRIEKEGGDPVADYSRYRKQQDKESVKTEREKADKNEWFRKDRESFVKENPGVDLKSLIDDPSFQSFAEGKVGRIPLSEIYNGYRTLVGKVDGRAKDLAAQAIANRQASPGSAAANGSAESDFFTAEQVRKMSPADVRKNYEKIRQSMTKW